MLPRFSITRRINFAETDMAGVMHFSHYFRLMEEVEHEFFRSRGLSVVMHDGGREISWPRVSASCEYSGPLRFEDVVELQLKITRIGSKSLSYEVDFVKDGQRVATGKLTSVCVAVEAGKFSPTAIPAAIRRRLEAAR